MRKILIILALFVLAGCIDQKALMKKIVPAEDDAFARQFIALVKAGRYDQAAPMVDPELRKKAATEDWDKMRRLIDRGEPQSFEPVIFNLENRAMTGAKPIRQVEIGYQLRFQEGWLLIAIVTQSSAEGRLIVGANFQPLSDSLEVLNRFDFNHKKVIHQVFLGAFMVVPMLVIIALLVCIGSRVRRRWLWIIFILLGCFAQFQINWSTGEWSVQPLSFLVLGAGFWRPGIYGPWILKFAIPVGAIVFLACLPFLRRKDEPPPLPEAGA